MKEAAWIVLVLCLAVERIGSLSIPTDVHSYCDEDSCPPYKLVKRIGELELRCYRQSIWVSVSGQGKLYAPDHNLPEWKLHQFFAGNNTKNIKVPKGSLTSRVFDESRRTFSAEYYVPNHFWKNVPRQVDPSVRVIYRSSFCAFVYGFPGWIYSFESIPYWRSKARLLIDKYGHKDLYYPLFFFYVNYHSKSSFIPQYNEIWYIVNFSANESITDIESKEKARSLHG